MLIQYSNLHHSRQQFVQHKVVCSIHLVRELTFPGVSLEEDNNIKKEASRKKKDVPKLRLDSELVS